MKFYRLTNLTTLRLWLLLLSFGLAASSSVFAQDSKCNDCFSTEVNSIIEDGNCITIELQVDASECAQALSHFTVEIPCGTVTEASNSMGWPMELNSTDPTTNIYGLKVDETEGFGEDGVAASFTVNYTVCTDDAQCLDQLLYDNFTLGYKAGECVFTDELKLKDNQLEASINPTHIMCYGNTGSIDVTVTNGTEPITFQWNNGATSEDIDNLQAGSYSVVITDASGESLTLETVITEPEAIKVNASVTHANCGQSDGNIHLEISGGTSPYEISWSSGDTGASINNISGGTYYATITDALGCSQSFKYTVIDQTDLQASINTNTIECHQEGNGTLTVVASGGTEPYTYLWSNGETTETASNLTSGNHKVTVTDANGCSITKTGYVVLEKLSVNHSIVEPTCNGDASGSATITITDGTEPYDIVWNNGETSSTITDLTGGWYWADITDANGCTTREYVKVSEPNAISINASVKRASCQENDSSIIVSIEATGGTPPYDIYYKDQLTNGEINIDKEGYYEFTATDANGCSITESIYITRPEAALDFSVFVKQPDCQSTLGSAEININDGTAPYNIIWPDGNNGLSRYDLTAGEYLITIEDANGCSASQTIVISEATIPSVSLSVPNAVICGSVDNIMNANVENAELFSWTITNADDTWFIQDEQPTQLLYTAGIGAATITLEVTSIDGCTASDSVTLSCDNSEDDIDGTDDVNNNDSTPTEECENTCFDIIPVDWYQTYDGCYTYHARVSTDGSCRHELSHLTVEVLNGSVSIVENSNNWKTELNNTDPTSGLYGFKVDDISNFGKENDAFDLSYNVCFNNTEAQTEFVVAYKAATCIMLDTLTFEKPQTEPTVKSYPNPFVDQTTIEFTAETDGNALVNIYSINGELVKILYSGPVEAGTTYSFDFTSQSSGSTIYFYRIICGEQSMQGKIIQTKR
ncbi:T9SS type A sorting domain-containing protein [Carboxylicivirga sp. A043]|uniref:T9SS type A sorting domain-containing protein n=1 Tax=Carboxylicivirga litoralis TaxID=2816963 RepID=UPI0021CB53DB|nr:T9SS type A sorting domain-containing protein [Carboxylicivirga sp. A043]MCU4154547.1 T9SS type A sorting domain-containing protein [Carboxylicivirga sp. A043]